MKYGILNAQLRRTIAGACQTVGSEIEICGLLTDNGYFIESMDRILSSPEDRFWGIELNPPVLFADIRRSIFILYSAKIVSSEYLRRSYSALTDPVREVMCKKHQLLKVQKTEGKEDGCVCFCLS